MNFSSQISTAVIKQIITVLSSYYSECLNKSFFFLKLTVITLFSIVPHIKFDCSTHIPSTLLYAVKFFLQQPEKTRLSFRSKILLVIRIWPPKRQNQVTQQTLFFWSTRVSGNSSLNTYCRGRIRGLWKRFFHIAESIEPRRFLFVTFRWFLSFLCLPLWRTEISNFTSGTKNLQRTKALWVSWTNRT